MLRRQNIVFGAMFLFTRLLWSFNKAVKSFQFGFRVSANVFKHVGRKCKKKNAFQHY